MYHQNKVIKTNITKIRLPCYGPNNAHNVGNVETVISKNPKEIEEHLTNFFDDLFNGRMDKNLKDTSAFPIPLSSFTEVTYIPVMVE